MSARARKLRPPAAGASADPFVECPGRPKFLLAHGMVDLVVERRALKATIAKLLSWTTG